MTRWKITIEYDGRSYAGWQIQDNVLTVQEEVERAISQFCQQEIKIKAAGRTDAGVHARGQVAHFDLDYRHDDGSPRAMSGFEMTKAINAYLRDVPVAISHTEEVSGDFQARYDAINKEYMYRIVNRSAPPKLDDGYVWYFRRKLDVDAMIKAAPILVGHHDFTSFRATLCQAKSPMRTLDRLEVISQPYDEYGGKEIRIFAEGRSFLHHMVRNIVGTLTLVGEHKWTADDLKDALAAKKREAGGTTAPPEGLTLMRVDYPEK